MGACASKPKDLDTEDVPVPAPVEAPVVAENTEAKEAKDGDEPLVDISEAVPETTGEKTVVEEAKEVAETVATA
ncbi:hypothetical protein ACS0TY_010551 [Phlomoides rotata]